MAKRAQLKPRKSPRQARSVATVVAVLDAAARILKRDGYEKASVNRIAVLAGVSVGSLYQYFPTKESLVVAVARRHTERMIEVFQRDLAELAHAPMPDAVRGVVRRTFDSYALDPALRRLIVEDEPWLGVIARSHDFDDMLRGLLKGYLSFHAESVRPRNFELAVRILMAAVEGIAVAVLIGDPATLASEELVDETAHLVLGYLTKT